MLLLAEFEFYLAGSAGTIYESLLPELGEDYQRTKAALTLRDDVLILNVEADDIVSMRAALNGWLRLVKISCEMSYIVLNI
ncbi:MAG: KEOPS complex subunit Pcc1 [Candidatus Methanoperedens sp.]|nr:KEOPS complex subunit Pcc1 [Candidatus Methanoperedens sp.]